MKNRTTPTVSNAATTIDGEKFSGRAGSSRGRGGTIAQARPGVDRVVAIDAEPLCRAPRLVAGRHRSVIPGLVAGFPTRVLAAEHDPRVRSVERADVPPRLQLVDDACGPRIS